MIDSQPVAANPVTHYIIVRSNLPVGIQAAQIAHAAGESSPGNLDTGTYAIVLQANSESLSELEQKLQDDGVSHRAIRESDVPYTGDLLAIGLRPEKRTKVKRYVSSLPLLR